MHPNSIVNQDFRQHAAFLGLRAVPEHPRPVLWIPDNPNRLPDAPSANGPKLPMCTHGGRNLSPMPWSWHPMCIYVYTYIYIYMCIYMCIHLYICIYIYTKV